MLDMSISGNELNGITFGGVGSGTTVDYVQVHNNADDCVEFFGGTVDVKHSYVLVLMMIILILIGVIQEDYSM